MKRLTQRIAAVTAASLLALPGIALAEGHEKPDASQRGDVASGKADASSQHSQHEGMDQRDAAPAKRDESGAPGRMEKAEKPGSPERE